MMNNKTLTLLAVALGGYYLYKKQSSTGQKVLFDHINNSTTPDTTLSQLEGSGYISTGSCCSSCSKEN